MGEKKLYLQLMQMYSNVEKLRRTFSNLSYKALYLMVVLTVTVCKGGSGTIRPEMFRPTLVPSDIYSLAINMFTSYR